MPIVFIIFLLILGYLTAMFVQRKKITDNSFSYGFSLSLLAYLISSFIFFWFSVFRRMSVLNIPLKFDSDVIFAIIIIPVIVAIPWLPFGIIDGLISWRKGNKNGLRFFCIFTLLITIILSIVFWNLQYN